MTDEPKAGPGIEQRAAGVAQGTDLTVVSDALVAGRDAILDRWLEATRRQPFHRERPAGAVADHIPRLFDALVVVIGQSRAADDPAPVPLEDAAVEEAATAHAQARFEQGLGPVAVTTEFRLLRQEIARALTKLLDDDAPAIDVVGGIAIVSDALDGAATIGLTALSDRIESLRESFLATTLHDVRQPITLVEGSLLLAQRWLEESDPDIARLRESVGDALLASGELVAMIDTLSDASRVATGSLQPDPEPTALDAVIREAVDAFGETARTRVQLRIAPGPRLIGSWDPGLIRRLVSNLVGNALKYSPLGSEVVVSVGASDRGMARLAVTDRGMGMNVEDLSSVFERFVRSDRARRSGAPGLGLGLYACRGIVTAHGGTIQVDSAGPDRGTTVTVELPLLPAEEIDSDD